MKVDDDNKMGATARGDKKERRRRPVDLELAPVMEVKDDDRVG
uniref:Uncharacterized protein n=1 Tax=Oryza sativa subsp. japonica TaxID=39947 RepID=Q75IG2_ORYSJ|nr:hypothetical protein [Oryza sativa Japonica Group]